MVMRIRAKGKWMVTFRHLKQILFGFVFISVLPMCVVGGYALPAHSVTSNEGKLRAAVIVGIMRFTSWPNHPQFSTAESIHVCLAGRPTSQDYLKPISGERKVAGKALTVKEVDQQSLQLCQVLVIGSSLKKNEVSDLLSEADSLAMLSVCDGCRKESSNEPIIHLTLRNQKVNFGVNLARAKMTGVQLDAQLLELASEVRK